MTKDPKESLVQSSESGLTPHSTQPSESAQLSVSHVVDERLQWSIAELTSSYRNGESSPVEVVAAALRQAETWEPKLNAFLSIYAEEAMATARQAEQQYADARAAVGGKGGVGGPESDLPPLLGVPIGLKDLVDVGGRRKTSGSRIAKDYEPSADADVWARLRQAGGVLLGKTNMLEFAYGVAHPDYGQTNNPYDLSRTSGGSSGGSAAAVATHSLFGAVGTDTGGSIRIPAAYCGVVGLKPTYGRIPVDGVFPLSYALDHVGPIARSATDAAILFRAMTANQSAAGLLKTSPLPSSPVPLAGIKAAFLPDDFLRYTTRAVKKAYHQSLKMLETLGVELQPLPPAALERLEQSEAVLMDILLPEAAHIHRKWWDRAEDYAPLTWQQIELGRKAYAVDYLRALLWQQDFRKQVEAWLSSFDVLVMPTVDFPAPAEDPAIGDETMDEMRYTGPFNVSGHPAVTVCCGFSDEGLPVGLQLVGRWYEDERLLQMAAAVEAVLWRSK